MALDVLTIGDPTIDTSIRIHDAHVALQVHPERAELHIDYADKIPVDEMYRSTGGNCVNAARAARRLGLDVAVYGVTGDDLDGRWIRQELAHARVDTSLMAVDRKRSTNASIALIFRGERTLFVWHQPRHYHLPVLPETAWIYATSVGPLGPAISDLHSALLRALRHQPAARLAFSPGTHQLRMGAKAIAPMLCATELLLLNREEAEELTCRPKAEPRELLQRLHALGPRKVVMTDGIRGSYGYDGERYLRTGVLKMPVVDRTGAGDSYGATVMTALHLGLDLGTAMAWGTAQAAFVVSALGAAPGLVDRRRLQAVVGEHPGLVAKAF
ncbi:MAG TPA: carbohydrate kinase family protein [Candidatus Dormibacteraeota bacterium]|nr:carbohydrate kinase family protein [Candidatus Dormibacteraeota bacterium]